MSDPLQDVITALGAKLAPMSGLVRWYADPPEALAEFPCALAFANNGDFTLHGGGWAIGRHTITINIYQSRQVLPVAIDAAKVWPYRVLTALAADVQLNSTVETWEVGPLRYRFGPLQYGSETHYGVSLDITVKINDAVTVG